MLRFFRTRVLARSLALAMVTLLTMSALASARSSYHQTVALNYHPQAAASGLSGPVGDGATATIVRRDGGLTWRLQTHGLRPGHAYTIWFVALNAPGNCLVQPCSGPDIVTRHLITDAQVTYGGGHVGGGSGRATFAGSFQAGPIAGWFEGGGLWDPTTAQIQLVLNDHGPVIPGMTSEMIHTYRAGCTDASLPGLFHAGAPAAIADGTPGPNACQLFQTAVFAQP
ncbi:MAG: hypothetical protein ABIW50_09650 [Candidatus Limnocylindria bacterium]